MYNRTQPDFVYYIRGHYKERSLSSDSRPGLFTTPEEDACIHGMKD
jgi:hypothetical protein